MTSEELANARILSEEWLKADKNSPIYGIALFMQKLIERGDELEGQVPERNVLEDALTLIIEGGDEEFTSEVTTGLREALAKLPLASEE